MDGALDVRYQTGGLMRATCRTLCAIAPLAVIQPAFADPVIPANPYDPPSELTEAGMTELGVGAGLWIADGVHDVAVTPSAGRFVADNLELAATFGLSHSKDAAATATIWSALVEPSYHVPLNPFASGVLGMAAGIAYQHTLGANLMIAPRVGLEVAFARHHIVSMSLAYSYLAHSAAQGRDDAALVALSSALRLTLGYAIRW